IGEAGHAARRARPPIDHAYRICDARPDAARVVMRAELGLVGRHIDIDRAIVLAALAGEAEIERLLDRIALPSVLERPALHHLEQQVRAAARRVLLFARRQVARAHDTILGVMPAAFADADATDRGAVPAALARERKVGIEAR